MNWTMDEGLFSSMKSLKIYKPFFTMQDILEMFLEVETPCTLVR